MKEKRIIKLRTDMYEDTKFKIIDTMAERDTINYIWTRVLTLCGKVNDAQGRLYVTKDMPYTIEILALEFNRTEEQVENAMRVFNDLNMVCRDEDGVYKVCNWNKYQGGSSKGSINEGEHEIILKEEIFEQNKEENLAQDNKVISSEKLIKNDDKSSRDSKDNKNETNIIDITNGNLVKDKNENNIISKKQTKAKAKIKRKNEKSKKNITCDSEEDYGEINYFQDESYKPEGRRVALFEFK
ncbi:MAG: phage replisome organizer N-terminal domain-containing protein [Clostridium sp.]|nr:phage replisome organizer N-terminal domain-containing protein [Clostridium sp.]